MSAGKSCLLPQLFLTLEARRVYGNVARNFADQKIKGQIRDVSRALGVKHDTVVRAKYGRIGGRAFPKLWAAYLRWDAEQTALGNLEWRDLDARIARLENLLDRGNSQAAAQTCKPDLGSGLALTRHKTAPG